MANRMIRHIYRNVDISKDLLHRIINSLDADDNGRISLAEVAIALKLVWKQAMGKIKAPKKSKVKTLD